MPTAMITGAAGGLGVALAETLAPRYTLLLSGRPSQRLDQLADRLGATTWPLDLTDVAAVAPLVEPIASLDVLVHNAGVAYPGRVAESTEEQWRTTMTVNVVGAVALTVALLPALRRAGGHVVFVNSGSGIKASPGLASYSASKSALRSFADSLRADEPDVRVTSVYPGRIDTAMQRDLVSYEGGEYDAARFLTPATVAEAVAHALATAPDGDVHEVVLRPRRP